MYASTQRLCIGATSDMKEVMKEAVSPSRERQSTCRPCEKIFGDTCWQQGATLYEAPAAKGQTRAATSYFCRTLPSNPGNQKKCHKATLTSFHIHTPSI